MPTMLTADNQVVDVPSRRRENGGDRLMEALFSQILGEVAKVPAMYLRNRMPPTPQDQAELELRRAQIAALPSQEERAADLENKRAMTEATRAQARNRQEENSPATAIRNTVATQEALAGNVRGAEEIAAGKQPPGAAPSVVEAARARAIAAANQMVENAKANPDRRQATRDLTEQTLSEMQRIRNEHPGPTGEQLARDIGEITNQELYGEIATKNHKVPTRDLLDELTQAILRNKAGQFGAGKEGVTADQVRRGVLRAPEPGIYERSLGNLKPWSPGI